MRDATDDDADSTDLIARLEAARAFIERHFHRDPSLGEVARVAHLSPYYFHRLFSRRHGKSPKQMIIELRIREVQRLALKGVSLTEASKAAGFAHQSHMTTRFRRVMGTTPGDWLRTARSRSA